MNCFCGKKPTRVVMHAKYATKCCMKGNTFLLMSQAHLSRACLCSWEKTEGIYSILVSLISMTALRQRYKLKIDGDRWPGNEACLWSWALFGDRRWSVTCSRCYWWNSQGLGPDPPVTAVCKQRPQRGNCSHDYICRANSWQMHTHTPLYSQTIAFTELPVD